MIRFGGAALIAISSLIVSDALARQGSGATTHVKPHPQSPAAAIDKVFATWNKATAPGCAVAAVRDGHPLYSHGYGMADLEHGVPITHTTVFHIASVSKQFTAFAVYLLAQEGKLALDDDIRKVLPELHDFGKTITIRQLIHHTSGLRDQWTLLEMAGWRLEDVITEKDILRLVWRQKGLNFAPGEMQLYSNTGYTLLGVIVKRVSGQSLREFAQERIFKPLGMEHTHFHDQYGELVKARAYSYARQGEAYRYIALSYSNVGATSLFTTVDDLALWDENFYSGKVGGKDLVAQMQIKGKLNNGTEIGYASALAIGTYRGLQIVEHDGGDAGFRTDLLRFPDQHFSVIALCNAADANPASLARQVADIFLAAKMEEVTNKLPTEITIDAHKLDAYIGQYELEGGLRISFWREGDQFITQAFGQPSFRLFPFSETGFFVKAFDAQVTFDKPDDGGKAQSFNLHQNGRDMRAKRMELVQLKSEQLQTYAGTFYSDELDTLYTVTARDGKLFLNYPRDEVEIVPNTSGVFTAPSPIGTVTYKCGAAKRCTSFTLSNGRAQNLRFDRVELKSGAARP